MQFKHPEILYALFLLVIPIIVHLFQLRRFERVSFTNVKFLKEVEIQTRKSSKLKKFLVLCARLLAFTALILAFTQPFLSSIKKEQLKNTYVYLDNSMSMQAMGEEGALLKRASQDLIEVLDNGSPIQLVTNDNFYRNLSGADLQRELLNIDYHPLTPDLNTLLFRIDNDLKNKINEQSEIILISDFQNLKSLNLDSTHAYRLVQVQPVAKANINIDSLYIADQNSEYITLNAVIKSYESERENVAVSLFNEEILQGKSNTSLEANDRKTLEFVIRNQGDFNGRLSINEADLIFDNERFFAINKQPKINVLAIGANNQFLSKIYTQDEFKFNSSTIEELDYSKLSENNLIVLNEITAIPEALIRDLADFVNDGGSLAVIPALNFNITSYQALYDRLSLGRLATPVVREMAISKINFNHPVLKNVFEREVDNFQYPSVQSYVQQQIINSSSILSFENEQAFISQVNRGEGRIYILSAAINKQNATFRNSPLIVPVFYNFAILSYRHAELSYTIGQENELEVEEKLQKDDILQISNGESSFIPLQKIGNNSVQLSLSEQPLKSGFYQLKDKERIVKNLAFNYNRSESDLNYPDLQTLFQDKDNVQYYSNVKSALSAMNNDYKTSSLWPFFIVAALLFLLIEIGLLKFLKS